jgi:hypothetical protein
VACGTLGAEQATVRKREAIASPISDQTEVSRL